MLNYVASRTCPCLRCKASELLAPSLLVTFGLLVLLGNLHWASFGRTWPVMLIVVGGVRLLQSTAPTVGHGTRPEAEEPAAPDAVPDAAGISPVTPEVSHEQ